MYESRVSQRITRRAGAPSLSKRRQSIVISCYMRSFDNIENGMLGKGAYIVHVVRTLLNIVWMSVWKLWKCKVLHAEHGNCLLSTRTLSTAQYSARLRRRAAFLVVCCTRTEHGRIFEFIYVAIGSLCLCIHSPGVCVWVCVRCRVSLEREPTEKLKIIFGKRLWYERTLLSWTKYVHMTTNDIPENPCSFSARTDHLPIAPDQPC